MRWRRGSCIYPQLNRPVGVEACSERGVGSELVVYECVSSPNKQPACCLAAGPCRALPGLAVLPCLPPWSLALPCCLASLECSMEARFSPTRFSPTSSEEAGSSPVDGQSSSYCSSGRLPSLSGSPKTPKQWRHRGTEGPRDSKHLASQGGARRTLTLA